MTVPPRNDREFEIGHEKRLVALEKQVYGMEMADWSYAEVFKKHEEADLARHAELKALIEQHEEADLVRRAELKALIEANSIRTIIKENFKWIALVIIALLSGAEGVATLVAKIPELLK